MLAVRVTAGRPADSLLPWCCPLRRATPARRRPGGPQSAGGAGEQPHLADLVPGGAPRPPANQSAARPGPASAVSQRPLPDASRRRATSRPRGRWPESSSPCHRLSGTSGRRLARWTGLCSGKDAREVSLLLPVARTYDVRGRKGKPPLSEVTPCLSEGGSSEALEFAGLSI